MNESNIVSDYIVFSKQCINKYFKIILDKDYNQDICNKLINLYIDTRYYSSNSNLPFAIRATLNNALTEFKGLDLKTALNVVKTFNFIMYFDNVTECDSVVKVIEALAEFRQNVLNIPSDKVFQEKLLETIKEDLIKKKEYIDAFDVDKFNFEQSLTNIDKVYNVILNQNLKFPNVYNSAVIDKVFKSKDLADKRALVEYNYTAHQVLKDIIKGNHYEYLVDYPREISKKEEEMDKLFNIFNNEVLIDRISIKINFDDFLKEKEKIYTYMRNGYKFAVQIDNKFIEDNHNLNLLKVFKYIIVKRRNSFIEINTYKNIIKVE